MPRSTRMGVALLALTINVLVAAEYQVSLKASGPEDGSATHPFRTISAAARIAQSGDTITVHEGIYRERVTPPRGGESDARRIVYQAAPSETVSIRGSEVIRGWKLFMPGVWKAVIPNSLFGKYNPYNDLIAGDWFNDKGRPHHTGEVYLNGKSLWETNLMERVLNPEGPAGTWFAEVDANYTYIYANFRGSDPNRELVEINVRDACFYPDQPGRNYITVRGFRMSHAATQWAAPTAEQIGLIGTHWSRGWIIENNVISDSKSSGITLGKDRATGHNVWTKDPSKDGAIHYNEVIERALKAGWSRENTGSHIVRNNVIRDCEQAGIAGSLGAVFSLIENNHIYNIWVKRQFAGAEIGGIKLHGAIDVVIRGNRVHNAGRGLWLDWMAQGTRVTGNLFYDNTTDDVFVEVNHGPFVVDNNVFLSKISVQDWSEGGAFVHNLIGGRIVVRQELKRSTPWHLAHSTALGGLSNIKGGDHRFFNNLFVGGGEDLTMYRDRETPVVSRGNAAVAGVELREDGVLVVRGAAGEIATRIVTGSLLGKTAVSGLPFDNADGSPVRIDQDYLGQPRGESPTPGPFEKLSGTTIRLWQ